MLVVDVGFAQAMYSTVEGEDLEVQLMVAGTWTRSVEVLVTTLAAGTAKGWHSMHF